MQVDVAILGGGPGGSTAGSLLKKYDKNLDVLILEKERFPREHVGESQLPAIGYYLDEMGVWDKVEAANFPIKVGATYCWGKNGELWDFEFLPLELFRDEPRPGKYEDFRRATAFQVDRAIYDDILLRHAEGLGCKVREECKVLRVERDGDRVTGLVLDGSGETVTARHYIDATGHAAVLRRAMGVGTTVPTSLMNIAVWDYWENAEWAVRIGVGGTRVQVLSLPNGWIWFIPLGPTRTSIGFICPVSYYKQCGRTPEQLYAEAIERQPRVKALTAKATREGRVRTTNDWSFVSDRLAGENWFLVGEAAGFADPILAGGLTLTHDSARHAAYLILALDRTDHDPRWLKDHYTESQRQRVLQYIRFADFWYAANGQFKDLTEFSSQIARESGLRLSPQAAFRWLSLGGFNPSDGSRPGIGGLDLGAVKEVTSIFTANGRVSWEINNHNVFHLDLRGATEEWVPVLFGGRIDRNKCWRRGDKLLARAGLYGHVMDVLEQHSEFRQVADALLRKSQLYGSFNIHDAMSTLECMLVDGWVVGKLNKKKPIAVYDPNRQRNTSNIHGNEDVIPG